MHFRARDTVACVIPITRERIFPIRPLGAYSYIKKYIYMMGNTLKLKKVTIMSTFFIQ